MGLKKSWYKISLKCIIVQLLLFVALYSSEMKNKATSYSLNVCHTWSFFLPEQPSTENVFDDFRNRPRLSNIVVMQAEGSLLKFSSEWDICTESDLIGKNKDTAYIVPLEQVLALNIGNISVKSGLLKFNWGFGDGINPTDKINPYDYQRSRESEKMPIPSFELSYFPFDWLENQFVLAPFFHADNYPMNAEGEIRRFFPTTTVIENSGERDLNNVSIGFRTNFYTSLFDLSFSYLYGIDKFFSPRVQTIEMGGYQVLNNIELYHGREQTLGINIRTTLDRFGFWGEGAGVITKDLSCKDFGTRNPSLLWVIGSDVKLGPQDELYLNVQQHGRYTAEFDNEFSYLPPNPGLDKKTYTDYYLLLLTDRLSMTNEKVMLGATLNFEVHLLNSLLNFLHTSDFNKPIDYLENTLDLSSSKPLKRYGSLYQKTEVDYAPIDQLHIKCGYISFHAWQKIGAENISIDKNDPVGSFHDLSALFVQFIYSWGIRN